MRRGEIRWYYFRKPDKSRPVLLLARASVVSTLNEIIVVPVTRTIRTIPTEVLLSEIDGMPTVCALNLDHVSLGQRSLCGSLCGSVLTVLPEHRWLEVQEALLIACGFKS